jgi:hypothetical protein
MERVTLYCFTLSKNMEQVCYLLSFSSGGRMRIMSFLAPVLVVGSLSMVCGQQGQGNHHQMMSVEDRVNKLKTELDLSADQVTKITAIIQDQRSKMQALHEKYANDHDGMHKAMSALRPTFDSEISAALTDAQRVKFDAMTAQRQKEKSSGTQSNTQGKPAPQNTKAQ